MKITGVSGAGGASFWDVAPSAGCNMAFVDAVTGLSRSFSDLYQGVNRYSHVLQQAGFEPGQVLVVALESSALQFLQLYFAAMQTGLYFAPTYAKSTPDEFAYLLRDSGATGIVVESGEACAALDAADGARVPADRRWTIEPSVGYACLDEVAVTRPSNPPIIRQAGEVLFYTSGTTGTPKAVWRRLRSGPPAPIRTDPQSHPQFSITEGPHLSVGPLYRRGSLMPTVRALEMGRGAVRLPRWDAEALLGLVSRFRITSVFLVPKALEELIALPDSTRHSYDVSSLRGVFHGAGPCNPATKRSVIDWLGPIVWEFYGCTEGLGTFASSADWLSRPGTVGKPPRGGAIKIFDDLGQECAPGVVGDIYIKAPGPPFEYLGDRAKTLAARRGDFFTVGDLGYLDDNGFLFLSDRKADIINVAGSNVYGRESEHVLMRHPSVVEVAVIGVPSDEWGEQVLAVVELANDIVPSPALANELLTMCRSSLSEYKCPEMIEFRKALPRLASGKILKRRLREEYRGRR